ncbi:kelch-like protein 24 [Mizuhopecten yessoensis]|uniref:kelch-like protein 24 n=1 Tax=Mizuhopecten yessoensis TaxID=6573 RepID=UPI000B45926C|nr:kelch-like protein 24 [Mizuhopecten yessoensis]
MRSINVGIIPESLTMEKSLGNVTHAEEILEGLYRLWKEQRYTDVTLSDGNSSSQAHKILVDAFMPQIGKTCRTKSDIRLAELKTPIERVLSWLYSLPEMGLELLKLEVKPAASELKIKFVLDHKPKIVKSKITTNAQLKQSWITEFSTKLRQCYKDGSFSDVILKVDGQVFRCHKAVLASVSPFFDTMFLSGMRETDAEEIDLHGVKESDFRIILDSIYLGEECISVTNVESLISTCTYFQLNRIQVQCERFLDRNADPENALGVLRLAELNSIVSLRQKSLSYIVHNFQEVVKCKEYPSLSKEQLLEMIKDDDLNVVDETEVFEAVLKWFSSYNRPHEDLEIILQGVSLLDVRQSSIKAAIADENLPQASCTILQSAVDKANTRSASSGRFRNEQVLLVVRASGQESGVHVACFSFKTKQWFRLASIKGYEPGSAFAACSLGRFIYLTGGSGNPCAFFEYSIGDNVWTSLPKYREARSEHVAVATCDSVYVLGGRNQVHSVIPSIERYNLGTRSWRHHGVLALPVSDASAAVVGSNILVCGGALSFGEYTDAIQCFDTERQTCSVIANLPMQCSFTDIALHDSILYIVSPRGHVMEYEYGRNPLLLGKAHTSSFMDFSCVYFRGVLYIVGGTSNKSESAEIRAFELSTQKQVVRKNVNLPWKRLSNQYYSIIGGVSRKYLCDEIKDV